MEKEIAALAVITALICPTYALRSFHLGCSTTDQFLHGMAEVAQGFGDTQEIGKYTIAGAGMHVLWHQREGRFQESTLRDQRWDAVICAGFPNGWELGIEADVTYSSYFYDLAYQGNPDAILYTWSVYADNDPSKGSWDAQWNNQQWEGAYASKGYHEALFLAAREKYGSARVRMMPIGHAMNKLHERIQSGSTTRFSSIFELYGDGIHLNEYGGYLGVMVHFAVLFGKNPQGAIRESKWGFWQVTTTIDEEFAALAQEIAWETVTELSEYTGVNGGETSAFPHTLRPMSAAGGLTSPGGVAVFTLDGRSLNAGRGNREYLSPPHHFLTPGLRFIVSR